MRSSTVVDHADWRVSGRGRSAGGQPSGCVDAVWAESVGSRHTGGGGGFVDSGGTRGELDSGATGGWRGSYAGFAARIGQQQEGETDESQKPDEHMVASSDARLRAKRAVERRVGVPR